MIFFFEFHRSLTLSLDFFWTFNKNLAKDLTELQDLSSKTSAICLSIFSKNSESPNGKLALPVCTICLYLMKLDATLKLCTVVLCQIKYISMLLW